MGNQARWRQPLQRPAHRPVNETLCPLDAIGLMCPIRLILHPAAPHCQISRGLTTLSHGFSAGLFVRTQSPTNLYLSTSPSSWRSLILRFAYSVNPPASCIPSSD